MLRVEDVIDELNVDWVGSNAKNIDMLTHDVLVYFAAKHAEGISDQDILCSWHFISASLGAVMDNTKHKLKH